VTVYRTQDQNIFHSKICCFWLRAVKKLMAVCFVKANILPPWTKAAWLGHRNSKHLCLPRRSDLSNHRKISASFLPEAPSCCERFHKLLIMCESTNLQVYGQLCVLLEPAANRMYSLSTYDLLVVKNGYQTKDIVSLKTQKTPNNYK
jgi:hypothetical protein